MAEGEIGIRKGLKVRDWSVENNLPRILDAAFREDHCRIGKDHSARNLAAIRRVALNMLRREPFQDLAQAQAPQSPHELAYREVLLAG